VLGSLATKINCAVPVFTIAGTSVLIVVSGGCQSSTLDWLEVVFVLLVLVLLVVIVALVVVVLELVAVLVLVVA